MNVWYLLLLMKVDHGFYRSLSFGQIKHGDISNSKSQRMHEKLPGYSLS